MKTKVDELRDALKKKHEAEAQAMSSAPFQDKAPEGSEEDIAAHIQAAEEEAKGHYDKLLRVMAEFENFKKRNAREREELIRYGNEKLLTDLLPALDDLDRVLDHIPPDASEETRKIAEGIELVRKSLVVILDRYGLKEVPALGEPFDPAKHEAIAAVESDSDEPDHVMAVHRKGYWLFDRLLRPAMVTVSKAKETGGNSKSQTLNPK